MAINNKNNQNSLQPSTQPIADTANRITGLRGTDIKTNVVKYSSVIMRNGVPVQQLNLIKICNLTPQNATLLVSIEDAAYPLILVFLSEIDQSTGMGRLVSMMNGNLVL